MEKSFEKKLTMCDMMIKDQTTDNQNSYESCTTHDICKTDEKQENNRLHPIVDWQKYNEDVLSRSIQGHHQSNVVDYNVQRAINTLSGSVDKSMLDSTNKIAGTTKSIHRWKESIFLVLEKMRNEIDSLLYCKIKIQKAQMAMGIVCSINTECLEQRSFRLNMDLTSDPGHVELVKERELINEIGNVMCRTLCQLNEQLHSNKRMKYQLEENWSNKNQSFKIDAINLGLNIQSPYIMSHDDVQAKLSEITYLSIPEWEAATKGLKQKAYEVLDDSTHLRSTINDLLKKSSHQLRCQADAVDIALARFISDTRQVGNRIEYDLKQVVERLGDSEKLVDDLLRVITNLEKAKYTAETRLHNRLKRPAEENCKDNAQSSLISEVTDLEEQIKTLNYQLECARTGHLGLQKVRTQLEDEARIKRKTLWIDTVKCQNIRAHYPSINALIGH